MHKKWALFIILFLLVSGFYLAAQEEDTDPYDPLWTDTVRSPYENGDKTFNINLGVVFPTYFGGSEIENNQHGLSLGGTLSLSYNYFLTSYIFAGAEAAAMFSSTRGGNMLFMVPFGARIGYQFLYKRFEIPIALMVGAIGQRYLDNGYFGLIIKPGASAYWRYNPDWSFGLNTSWWFVPQWPKNGLSAYGNFMELTLSARYHF